MRSLFVLLLFSNLVMLGWTMSGDDQAAAPTRPRVEADGVIRMLRESSPAARVQRGETVAIPRPRNTSVEREVTEAPAASDPAALRCVRIGPLEDTLLVGMLVAELVASGLTVSLEEDALDAELVWLRSEAVNGALPPPDTITVMAGGAEIGFSPCLAP